MRTPSAGLGGPQIVDGRPVPVVLGQMRSLLLGWGMATVMLYLASWLMPPAWNGFFRVAYLTSGLTWCLFAYWTTKHSLRLCLPIVLLFVLQLWSFFTMIHAWTVLGRPAALGRAELWILEIVIPFFISSCLVYIEPKTRTWILKAFLIGFGTSCAVAALQFLRVPGFYELGQNFYAQKDMDFWDGRVGLRAVGLTRHPYLLCFQALTCFAIVAAPLVHRKPKTWDVPLLFFFSGVVVFCQSRSLYLALAVLWIVVIAMMARRDALVAIRTASIGVAILVAAVLLAPSRLGYALNTGSSNDASYAFRVERRWVHSDAILKAHPITGIGPSNLLFLGEGLPDKYTKGMSLMESGYRVFGAMYGLPGMLLLILGLAGTIVVCVHLATNRRESDDRRAMGFLGMALTLVIAVNCYSSNTFDQYAIVPAAILLCGAMLRTREEQRNARSARPSVFLATTTETAAPAEPMSKLRAIL